MLRCISLYKLITGVNPFTGGDTDAVLDAIARSNPKPPLEINPDIPVTLQRICMKALSKPLSDRHQNSSLLARDLRALTLDQTSDTLISSATVDEPTQLIASPDGPAGVRPKGLRSFDIDDAAFFRKLLPGPFDVHGLPESLQFWKSRIESRKSGDTIRVGLIYGPSGCGKSSLVKAGLLPVLESGVHSIFVEATADQTEKRLLARLGQPDHDVHRLRQTLQDLKNNADAEQKTLIVIDQFEQWLHATPDPGQSELAKALRQCDGENLQCLLLVRDDFWLAVSRFMACLDVDPAQNQNMRLVDLFDPIHARRVLAEFGCGYGRLPQNLGHLSDDENQFLDAAIEGLMQDERIIPVRLALFAEMVKGRPWSTSTLKSLGAFRASEPVFWKSALKRPLHRRNSACIAQPFIGR